MNCLLCHKITTTLKGNISIQFLFLAYFEQLFEMHHKNSINLGKKCSDKTVELTQKVFIFQTKSIKLSDVFLTTSIHIIEKLYCLLIVNFYAICVMNFVHFLPVAIQADATNINANPASGPIWFPKSMNHFWVDIIPFGLNRQEQLIFVGKRTTL